MSELYTANISIDIKVVSAEHANELWLAAVKLVETSMGGGSGVIPGKGEFSFNVVETGNPGAGSFKREVNELTAKALRDDLD